MIKILISLTLFSMISSTLMAQSAEEKEVAAAVESLKKAMVDANKSALENLAATDLTYGHSNGLLEDKAAFVEHIVSGKSDFVDITLSEQTIKIVNGLALVRHKITGDVKNDGKPTKVNIGVLLIWQKQSGKWKLLARQAFKL